MVEYKTVMLIFGKWFVLITLILKIFIKRLKGNLMSHRNLCVQHKLSHHKTIGWKTL